MTGAVRGGVLVELGKGKYRALPVPIGIHERSQTEDAREVTPVAGHEGEIVGQGGCAHEVVGVREEPALPLEKGPHPSERCHRRV